MGLVIAWCYRSAWLAMIGSIMAAMPAIAAIPGSAALVPCVTASRASASRLLDRPDLFDCAMDRRWSGVADLWVRPAALPPGAGSTLTRIRFDSPWMSALTLVARYADGSRFTERLNEASITRHLRVGATIEIVLPVRPVRLTGLLWHVEGLRNFRHAPGGAELLSSAVAERRDRADIAAYALFLGLCLGLIVYNLALWAALRRTFQFAYCAMVAAIMIYAAGSSALVVHLFPALSNNRRMEIVYLLLPVTMALSLWFARSFIGPGQRSGRTDIAVKAIIGWLLASAAAFVVVPPGAMSFVDRLIGLGFVAVVLLTIPLLRAARRRGSTFALVFAMAWAAPATMASMRIVNAFHLAHGMFALRRGVTAVMAIEALLSSLAIAYRIHLLGRERDQAVTQEVAARTLAETDPLTDLLNRRAFLDRAVGRAGDQALVVIDIDHFKQVNDTIGHDGGDEVLRIFARLLRDWAGDAPLIARMGGEEFAAVFDAAGLPDTTLLLDKLRAAPMPYDLTVTASIGACLGRLADERDWKRLYQAADRALFQAKAAGRDRSRIAQPLAA